MEQRCKVEALIPCVLAFGFALWPTIVAADVTLPTIFGSGMVLQSDRRAPVWGWAAPGEAVRVEIAGQSHATTAGPDGAWRVELGALEASNDPLTLTVRGENTIVLEDVLVGEVWLCSGQSNMALPVNFANDSDLELVNSDYPRLRLITVVSNQTEKPQTQFVGKWRPSWPSTAGHFSAVCFFIGRELHQILGVPVGLIQSAEHNSTCEAWISRSTLEGDPRFHALLEHWAKREAAFEDPKQAPELLASEQKPRERAQRKGGAARKRRPTPAPKRPSMSPQWPGSLYNSLVHPIVGYGIRGVLWYQGESNAHSAHLYRDLFPTLIRDWRRRWGREDLPFYWIQLPAFGRPQHSAAGRRWAVVREAQTLAARELPHTAQAVTIDLGWYLHPRNKLDFARRLIRPVLALEYGREVAYRNPTYESMQRRDGKIVLTFENVGGGLVVRDAWSANGFAVAGSDRKFSRAEANVVGENRVEVRSHDVRDPIAVRYGWANSPNCNLFSKEGLPVVPFRTDDWEIEIAKDEEEAMSDEPEKHR